ncbi:MAG: hypothetical protein HMLKMBBP_03595 [Planctomycetes bacterium]|nr:hypothetical protein [Planctomycetota bacterium]
MITARSLSRAAVLVLAVGVGAAASAVLLDQPARAGDDAAVIAEKREKYRKTWTEKNHMLYFDLVYGIDKGPKEKPKLDSRWAMEDKHPSAERYKGVQFMAKFSDAKLENSAIDVMVQKFAHKTPGSQNPNISIPLDRAGKSVSTASKQEMIDGFYEDRSKSFKELVKDRCVPPKKAKTLGPAEMFASVVGTDENGTKKRIDICVWMGDKSSHTYLFEATYIGLCESKPDAFGPKVEELLQLTKELKNVPD